MNKYIYYTNYSNNKKAKKTVLIAIGFVIVLIGCFFIFQRNKHILKHHQKKNTTPPQATLASNNPKTEKIISIKKRIKKGENLVSILQNYLNVSYIIYLTKKAKEIYPLNRLVVGQPYTLYLRDSKLISFEYEINDLEKIKINFDKEDFHIEKLPIKYDVKTTIVKSIIESSLFEAVEKANEGDLLALKLSEIFAWDIDFIRDIRKGDSFKLIVEKKYRNGKFKGYGRILAAEFINQGRVYNAFLYTTTSGRTDYFDENGVPLRKSFLKAPLKFTRISSRFTYHRFHPILKVVRPHLGIDYAAPKGTPIKTVADGIVIKKAYDRAAGKYVKIRHPNGYVTIYNHMCRFAKGLRVGKRVFQGEVIGYVGSTGYATGPHLDFRVKHYGKYINPLKIKSTPLKPLPKRELALFKEKISPLLLALKRDNIKLLVYNKDPNQKIRGN
ncbi:peptidoglycan DD-metalloendopeptidase family protein [Desulfothermus sp.]